ncbi:MAG: hypothetical protein ABI431_03420 [Candidatus Tumulicola sp.]
MKATSYGRIVFGASVILFGVILGIWHDVDTWQSLHRILRLPMGDAIGDVLMVALIVGGILLIATRAVRIGAGITVALFAIFSIACIPGMFAAPKIYAQYGTFFEQFSILSGAIALYAANELNTSRAATLNGIARIGYGLSVVSFTLMQAVYFGVTAGFVPKWIPPNQVFWAGLTTVAFALAAIAILLNIRARLALALTGVMIAVFGLLVWVPALIAHPQSHNSWSEFALNAMIMAAAWVTMNAVGRPTSIRTISPL